MLSDSDCASHGCEWGTHWWTLLQSGTGPLSEVDGGEGLRMTQQMREREEGTSFEGQCHWRGREEEAQGESRNNQVVHQGRGERGTGKVVSSSFVLFPQFSPPFVLIPLLLPVFHTPSLLHF